jgi:SAM-dependent methyltransferase
MNQVHYKQQTIKAYTQSAQVDAMRYKHYFDSYAHSEAQYFLSLLAPGSIILDLGCGAGVASTFFHMQQHVTISADLSAVMLGKCKERGLRHLVRMDLEALPFSRYSFDAIWAHTSLLHIPKAHLRGVLRQLGSSLKSRGIFYIALKKGNGEGYAGSSGTEKWFSYFQGEEFVTYLPHDFDIVRTNTLETTHQTFLYYGLMKTL